MCGTNEKPNNNCSRVCARVGGLFLFIFPCFYFLSARNPMRTIATETVKIGLEIVWIHHSVSLSHSQVSKRTVTVTEWPSCRWRWGQTKRLRLVHVSTTDMGTCWLQLLGPTPSNPRHHHLLNFSVPIYSKLDEKLINLGPIRTHPGKMM